MVSWIIHEITKAFVGLIQFTVRGIMEPFFRTERYLEYLLGAHEDHLAGVYRHPMD